jgi:hypothetical protein
MAVREQTLAQSKHLSLARKRSVLGVAVCTFIVVFAATELWSRPQHAKPRRPARHKARSLEAEHYGETVRACHCMLRPCSAFPRCHSLGCNLGLSAEAMILESSLHA